MDLIVISGGQTGADRGGVRAAMRLGYFTGGWCPKGRKADDGPIPPEFNLMETESADYKERTRRNVVDADATLILTYEPHDALTGGTKLTEEFVAEHKKRGMVLALERDASITSDKRVARFIRGWIEHHHFGILNVAGPREKKAPGIEAHAMLVVGIALQRKDRCICGRLFPATVWENKAFVEEGSPLRCSTCSHSTCAQDFRVPTSEQLESIRDAART